MVNVMPFAYAGLLATSGKPKTSYVIMSFEGVKLIWKNGEMIPWADATVHVSAHALHYGSGVLKGYGVMTQ